MTLDKKTPPKIFRVKIISLGNPECGKSCVIKRYCEKRFVSKYLMTIGIDFGVTRVTVKDKDVKVNIFDFAGHPIFYEVRNEFYKDVQGALLVYDVCNRSSFESLDSWLQEMKTEMVQAGVGSELDSVFFVVCANKVDKRSARVIDELEGRMWADVRGYPYFETSAQTGEGVNEVFKSLFEGVVHSVLTGSKPHNIPVQLGYSKEQVDAIQRLKSAKDNFERLDLRPGASKDDINKAYRKLAVLLHPDKNVAPGSDEAFKLLVAARTQLLQQVS